MRAGRHFDPIDLEVLWNRLVTLVDEAAYAIIRTSMSKVVVEGRDFGVMLYDGEGNLLAADASIASKQGVVSGLIDQMRVLK
ncbi:MAG: hydantoinase B/oxoprolinase family protein [Arenicellales bacterium]|nr:hydantoinase B/oxoprolinase family protein [Arenicellales bacterium]